MSDRFEYPAIFRWSNADKAYLVTLIDFDAHTWGIDWSDAYNMAQDLLGNCIADYREENKPLPTPSKHLNRQLTKNEKSVSVAIYYDEWHKSARVIDASVLDTELV